MKRIIFFYQHIVREYRACQKIAGHLSTLFNDELNYRILSIDYEWVTAYVWAKRHGIDAIAMPWIRQEQHQGYLEPFFRINPDLTIINLDQEQIGSPSSMKLILPACDYARNGALHLAWSPFFKEELLHYGVRDDRVAIVGNARLDLVQSPILTKSDLAKEFGLDLSKKWLLFTESRSGKGRFYKEDLDEKLASGYTLDEIKLQDEFRNDSLDCFEQQLNQLPKSFFSKYEFIYRAHPGQEIAISIPSDVKIISKYSVSEWLSHVEALVTFGSTTAFEADRANVPVIIHMPVECKVEFIAYGLLSYYVVQNLIDITEGTIQEAASLQAKETISQKYMGTSDGYCAHRAAEAIFCEMQRLKQSQILPKKYKKELRRKVLYELKVWFSVKLGLMQKKYKEKWNTGSFLDIPYRKDSFLMSEEYKL